MVHYFGSHQVQQMTRFHQWKNLDKAWRRATETLRPDWRLPTLVMDAVGLPADEIGVYGPLLAAVLGCLQMSIILGDDALDGELTGDDLAGAANMALALQARAVMLAANAPGAAVALVTATAERTALGQAMDATVGSDLDEKSYWEIVRLKSSSFYRCALGLGALAAKRPLAEWLRLGALLGEMIQVVDDLQDAFAAPAAPDWTRGTNLLLLYGGLQGSVGDSFDLESAQQRLIDSGAVVYAGYILEKKREEALATLDRLDVVDDTPIRLLVARQADVVTQLKSCG